MTTDDHRQRFAEILATQPVGDGITYEQVLRAQSRQDLGISSLNMIIVLMNYIKKYTDGTIAVRPEWVPRLNDIDDIVAVLREIDAIGVEPARS
ncbi:hypothetical protein GCM10010168_13250 [Actinoplanes ianthinogenes]|uniref:Acyl carrier protein n=1 Tax=Actinoplanes ianthinogenes TaxID=122358 RepID=A0ABM7LZ20_9ACTN|nr:hypothetical protein [Actinoplanes ianthinogenes]BCJ44512.1 hypothetical protein Aiant_51690 [Actinoplanes ianthinogenes]GGQ98436.1 hypothetical protein GCM10010168_13250 [Actinoplanes ianthinogenes]